MCLKPKMKGRPRGRLGLPLPYTTVLLLLGWHDVSLEEQQHAMVRHYMLRPLFLHKSG